jgi:hypothetical protein
MAMSRASNYTGNASSAERVEEPSVVHDIRPGRTWVGGGSVLDASWWASVSRLATPVVAAAALALSIFNTCVSRREKRAKENSLWSLSTERARLEGAEGDYWRCTLKLADVTENPFQLREMRATKPAGTKLFRERHTTRPFGQQEGIPEETGDAILAIGAQMKPAVYWLGHSMANRDYSEFAFFATFRRREDHSDSAYRWSWRTCASGGSSRQLN